jgi:hypothetical protein
MRSIGAGIGIERVSPRVHLENLLGMGSKFLGWGGGVVRGRHARVARGMEV